MAKKFWTTEIVGEIARWHRETERLESEYSVRYAGTGADWDKYESDYNTAEAMLTKSLRPVLRKIDRITDSIADYERLEGQLWADIEATS